MCRFACWNLRRLVAPVVLMALAAVPGHAQTYRTAVGLLGGWSTAGDLTPGMGDGTNLENGWVAGAQLEAWPRAGRVGMRVNATVASRGLDGTQRTFTVAAADLAVMLRLLSPARDRTIAPFVALGAGPVLYRGAEGEPPLGDGSFGDDPVIRVMVAPSVGVDLLTASRVGIRLEIVDQIVFPSIGISPPSEGTPRVHNPGAQAAVQLRFGRTLPRPMPPRAAADRRPAQQPTARAPTPAPREADAAPEPAPTPAPPPEPAPEPAPEPVPAPEPAPAPAPRPSPPPARAGQPLGQPAAPAAETPAPRPAPAPAPAGARPLGQPAPAPAAPTQRPVEASLFTVQIGAFAGTDLARDRARRLEGTGLPVWLTEADVRGQRLVRVRVGAADSRADARLLAQKLTSEFGFETMIEPVPAGENIPADAIVATLQFLFPR